ncbi:MAG TPA: hypothetical protein VEI02_17020, partial [Planctomycetota bacterium]|nr:hypothetical protein [Planctomycetota bacterium]
MPRTFSSAAFAALLACVATAQAPVNDQPSGALVFSEPSTLFDDNSASALDGPYPLCGNPTSDLWYLFVPTTSGVATVTTCSAAGGGTGSLGSLGDSILGAWTDGGGFPATAITCDDDFCASQFLASMMTFPVTAGVPVYLSVCGYGLSSGTYLLDVTVVVASPSVFSDDCASATTVSEGVHPYDTSGFGVAGPAPGCTGYANDPFDGWLAYVPSATGFATASNCPGSLLAPGGAAGGGFDTYLAVWDGASCPPSGPELA